MTAESRVSDSRVTDAAKTLISIVKRRNYSTLVYSPENIEAFTAACVLEAAMACARPAVESGSYADYETFPSNDRDMLLYLMRAFDSESFPCGGCGRDEETASMDSAIALRDYLSAHPSSTDEQAGELDGFTSEDVSNLHSLCRVLENLSKKRAPDPRDLDAEHFVTANINHAVKSATYWLPIVKGIYMRLYWALAEKSRRADNEDTQPRPVGLPEGYRLVPVEPTEAMLVEGRNENLCCADDADRIYAAMIAAAPDGEVG